MTGELATTGAEAAAALANEADQRIRATVRHMKGLWVDLAGLLYRFNRSGQWRDLGYETFEEYLAQPELELGRRWVYQLIDMYAQLVVERGVKEDTLKGLASSKVREVLPAVRRGHVTVESALSDAEMLSRPDLEERYRGLGSGPEPVIDATAGPVGRGPVPEDVPAEASSEAVVSARVPCPTCGGRGSVTP